MYDCANCDDALKRERGHCPFLEGSTDGEQPTFIDTTGNEAHDTIHACPMGIQHREPHARRDIELYHLIEKMGGAQHYYPAPLSHRDTVTLDTYGFLKAIQSRFTAHIHRQRARMDSVGKGAA